MVHFDLATRNVLLTHPNEDCKISDFGMARYISEITDDTFEGKGRA
jgi:tRNA A-37 threonylcarbamoyl transferase component Bud32